jgi:hypothetical protein
LGQNVGNARKDEFRGFELIKSAQFVINIVFWASRKALVSIIPNYLYREVR